MSNYNIDGDIWEPAIEEAFAKPTLYETLFQLWKIVTLFGGPSIGCVVLAIDSSINRQPGLSVIAGAGWVYLGLCLNASANRDSAYRKTYY